MFMFRVDRILHDLTDLRTADLYALSDSNSAFSTLLFFTKRQLQTTLPSSRDRPRGRTEVNLDVQSAAWDCSLRSGLEYLTSVPVYCTLTLRRLALAKCETVES